VEAVLHVLVVVGRPSEFDPVLHGVYILVLLGQDVLHRAHRVALDTHSGVARLRFPIIVDLVGGYFSDLNLFSRRRRRLN